MSILPPALDDRSFDDLVEEMIARIPAHTPEWTNPRVGDPGRTLIELFAWLTDTLLYRANLIPERQRLTFLRLLGAGMRPAIAARGLVSLSHENPRATVAVSLRPPARVAGPVSFETRGEVTVLPLTAEVYCKRPLDDDERAGVADVLPGLQVIYGLSRAPKPYVTTPVFPGGAAEAQGFDLIAHTVDKCLWLALLASEKELVADVRAALGATPTGAAQLINVGIAPAIAVPALFEEIGPRGQVPHVWEMSTGRVENRRPEYLTLDRIADSTAGLTRRGVVRLALPAARSIGAPSNDVRAALDAGVGDLPPRLDDPETAARLVAWLRLRPTERLQSLPLSWIGINAVEVDGRTTVEGRIVGQSDGSADQVIQLPGQSVEPETLQLQVEEAGRGFQPWLRVDDLALAGGDARAYRLDSEAGTVHFGDGVRGRLVEAGARVRVAVMRAGGGRSGNLPAGSLTSVNGINLVDGSTARLKAMQPLPTEGGEDAETVTDAERRIPALFRHRDRAVTADDYRALAVEAPGVRLGRVEVLPRFKPHQRRSGVPGVVSVMVLPFQAALMPPNPRADRPLIEAVHAHLDARRPLSTELYVIGCEYVPLGVSVGVAIRGGVGRDGAMGGGFSRDAILTAVGDAIRAFLWPLPPGGADGTGWPLGRTVHDRELEAVVARVPGVSSVGSVNLFERRADEWRLVPRALRNDPVGLTLHEWQLPELLSVVAVANEDAPEHLRGVPNPFDDDVAATVPVVPSECVMVAVR